MAGYTLEISNDGNGGSSTYTFDVQPAWQPYFDYEYNEELSPAVPMVEIETWHFRGATYRNATPGNVTSDLDTLTTLLRNKANAISRCTLKYNAAVVREIKTATHAQLMVRRVETVAEAGSWTNHWTGDIVVVGRRLLVSGGVVRLTQTIADTYDEAGRHTQTLTGRVEVTPGTNVVAQAQTYALASLGSSYIFTTGGGASGGSNIDIQVENQPTSTIATFRSEQREIGVAVPASASSWKQSKTIQDSPTDGRFTINRFTGRAYNINNAKTAVQAAKPSASVRVSVETQDNETQTYVGEYTQRSPLPAQSAFYSLPTVLSIIRRVTVRGGGQNRILEAVPGYAPYVTYGSIQPLTVTERVTVRATGVTDPSGIPLPVEIFPAQYRQANDCEDDLPIREEKAEKDLADVWSRSATRIYAFEDVSRLDFADLWSKLQNAPTYNGDPDFKIRAVAGA